MFRLTREVRLTVDADDPPPAVAANGHAGYPPLRTLAHFCALSVTLAGEPDPGSGYLVNIKQIDQVVRQGALPLLRRYVTGDRRALGRMAQEMFQCLCAIWPQLDGVQIELSPYTRLSIQAREHPMVRFSQKFEFSAAHRLHNPRLSPQANVELFGKCNNPHGHGHNYELEVTLRGQPDASGQLLPTAALETIVMETVIQKFDHKFLNIETPQFRDLNPTVENIAQTIYQMLKAPLAHAGADLAAVTVWETPKTWCEYSD
jgi:6-pyruvoyltetrahydropterin/6-carboxytetrahydropterin synthase